jgi:hypothetical protein
MRFAAPGALVAVGVLVVTLAAGAGTGPVTPSEWHAALEDAVTHHRVWPRDTCAAVVVARTHAPPTYKEGSRVVSILDRFLYEHCRKFGHLNSIRGGMTDRQVVEIGGAPVPWMSGPHCWVYRGRAFDGLSVCFVQSRVTSLSWAQHG